MGTYTAIITLRLTEDTAEDARKIAQQIVTEICDQSSTDCAELHFLTGGDIETAYVPTFGEIYRIAEEP